jgi:hypothetical protein
MINPTWTPITFALPKYYGDVLIVTDTNFMHVAYFRPDSKIFLAKDGKAKVVTHWMHLPKTPKDLEGLQ